jgi:hypothetical protein
MSGQDEPHTPPNGLIPPRDPDASPPPAPARRGRTSRPPPRTSHQHRGSGVADAAAAAAAVPLPLPVDGGPSAAAEDAPTAARSTATAAPATACRACGRASPLRYRGLCWSLDCALRAAGALGSSGLEPPSVDDGDTPSGRGEQNNENEPRLLHQQERDATTQRADDDEIKNEKDTEASGNSGCPGSSASSGGDGGRDGSGSRRGPARDDDEADCGSDDGMDRSSDQYQRHNSHQRPAAARGLQRLQALSCQTPASLSPSRVNRDKKPGRTDDIDDNRAKNRNYDKDDDDLSDHGGSQLVSDATNSQQRSGEWSWRDVARSSVLSQGVSTTEGSDGTDQEDGERVSVRPTHTSPEQGVMRRKPDSAPTPAAPPPSPSSPSTAVNGAGKSDPGDERSGVWADAVCAVRAGTTELCSLLGLRIPT